MLGSIRAFCFLDMALAFLPVPFFLRFVRCRAAHIARPLVQTDDVRYFRPFEEGVVCW